MLAGTTSSSEERRSGMRLADNNVRILSRLKYKFVCHLKLSTDMVGDGGRE